MSLGPAEILMVLVVALVLFGPKKLPEVSRQVGGALRELRKIQDTVQSEMRSVIDEHVGPVTRMTSHEPPLAEPLSPAPVSEPVSPPPALGSGEPDLGDEQHEPPPSASDTSDPDPAAVLADDPERPAIDGLSGGTFS
jgi:sec-independent protein translocase protein TatA